MVRAATALIVLALAAPDIAPAAPERKISPQLAAALERAPSGRVEMLVLLGERADLSGIEALPSRRQRGREVFERLTAVAARSQRTLLKELERRRVTHRAYWIANFVWVEGDASLANELSRRVEVARLVANPRSHVLQAPKDVPAFQASPTGSPTGIEPSLEQVNAPELWALGYTGQGAVIGGADTGFHWDHQALKNQYRGWNGSGVDHAHNWHDAIHSGGGSCGSDAAAPCDDNLHGTHTMGTMVGDDGGANRIGMAPGARWIGCRNMDQGDGTPATYAECFQWFVAPTDLEDENPDPDLAPDVINNSWTCTSGEGCGDVDILRTVIENTRAAGIMVVSSAGNSGSTAPEGCSTVDQPPALYDATFAVGAVTSEDVIVGFSSRGPVTVDGSDRIKPDVAAPGFDIRSSIPNDFYAYMSGTSMAAPHVAGLAALLVGTDPSLAGDPDALEALVATSAAHPEIDEQCGEDVAGVFPNNIFGGGRIDALAAGQELLQGGLIFRDDLELRGTARWSEVAP